MADDKKQTIITVNNRKVNGFSGLEYFPLSSFYETAINFSSVVSGECNLTLKLQLALVLQIAVMFVYNILSVPALVNNR